MPLYYRGPDVLITHEVFVVRAAQAPYLHTLPIPELQDVYIAAYSGLLHSRTQELRGTLAGQDVLLYQSSDSTRFGQVARALARALRDYEDRRDFPRSTSSVKTDI